MMTKSRIISLGWASRSFGVPAQANERHYDAFFSEEKKLVIFIIS
jgi:hypothetical protein